MKASALLVLLLAFVSLVFTQCDTEDQNLFGDWAVFQDTGRFNNARWEQEELVGWGMDGNNKWNDYWIRARTGQPTHYEVATCSTTSQGAVPSYPSMCGDCSITALTSDCLCYPYYDVAESYQESPKPLNEASAEETPEGWPSNYEVGNPPFETIDGDGDAAYTLKNCIKYKPHYVYYYTMRLRLHSDGKFEKSWGISKGFTPSETSWNEFCEALITEDTNICPVPSTEGATSSYSLFGAHYQYQSGEWREDFVDRAQFFHKRFENGCHAKTREERWPTANYCGGDSGWRFGAGATAHVRFGCDVQTFFDTETDFDNEVDDEDCNSVYVLFDQMNNLDATVDHYDQYHSARFQAMGTLVRDENCWYRSTFIDHRTDTPSYRTPCSAGELGVPLVGVLCAVLVAVLRNIF